MMRRTTDPDSFIGHNIDIVFAVGEAMARVDAQIHLVMPVRDLERLRQFSRPGAKAAFVVDIAPLFHQLDSAERFDRAKQDKAVRLAFHQHVQHPVRAVTEINVSRARFVSFDERARARSRKRMAGFVVLLEICFNLDNFSRAFSPDQMRSDKFARTGDRITSEKIRPNNSVTHNQFRVAVLDDTNRQNDDGL